MEKIKSWKDVSLQKYIDILKVSEKIYENENDRVVDILTILTDISKEDIHELEIKDYIKLQNKMSFIEREILLETGENTNEEKS